MNMNFEYNFSELNANRLHALNIRSNKELIDVLEDLDSQFHLFIDDKYPIIVAIGFTVKTKPLKIAFTRIGNTIIFLDARIASKTELMEEFIVILRKLKNNCSRVR